MGILLPLQLYTSDNVFDINRKLLDKYGRDTVLNQPRFRVVWSTSQIEKRYGEFEIFSEGGIFLRTERGVSEVRKYEEYPDMWVLEQLQPTAGNPYLEHIVKFSYEPLWVFGAANSNRDPIWKAVDLLVRNRLHGDPNKINMSPADLERQEEEKLRKEKEHIKEVLQDDVTDLAFSLKHGLAVTVPGVTNAPEVNGRIDSPGSGITETN